MHIILTQFKTPNYWLVGWLVGWFVVEFGVLVMGGATSIEGFLVLPNIFRFNKEDAPKFKRDYVSVSP